MKLIFLMAATGKYHFLIYHSALPLELVPEKLHTHTTQELLLVSHLFPS